MAGRVDPRDAPVLLTVIPNTAQSLKGVYNKNTDSNDKITVANEIIQYQGDLPGLKDGTTVSNPRSMSAGRFDSQEFESVALTVSGWYKTAITDIESFTNYSGILSFSDRSNAIGGLMAVFSGCASSTASAKRHIELISSYYHNAGNISIQEARLGTSNVETSGAMIELYINIPAGTSILSSQIMGNLASSVLSGMTLLETPVISDGILPDGVTGAAYTYASSIIPMTQSGSSPSIDILKESDNDWVWVTVRSPFILKRGSSITVNKSAGNMYFTGHGILFSFKALTLVTSDLSYSDDYTMEFKMLATGIAASLTNFQPYRWWSIGVNGSFEII